MARILSLPNFLPFLAVLVAPKLASGLVPVTGALTGINPNTGEAPIRPNINDLFGSQGPSWDLYVQSLQAMYDADWQDSTSYFQIAGIHGQPWTPWDDDRDRVHNPTSGYCQHGQPTFIPWHRPYLMLFEQTLVGHAIAIADRYPRPWNEVYRDAALKLRLPYWDWGMDEEIPLPISMPTVRIRTATNFVRDPSGNTSTVVANPLSTYSFPVIGSENGEPLPIPPEAEAWAIERCGTDFPAGGNRNLEDARIRDQLSANVFIASSLGSFDDWAEQLESIHNTIHAVTACGFQLSRISVSAFDPIFWLHHVNVDRIAAMVQAIRPEVAMTNSIMAGPALFTTSDRELIGANSPLRPFWRNERQRYRSTSVANINGLGYSYEGLEYWALDPATLRSRATQLARSLYSSSISPATVSARDIKGPSGRRQFRGLGGAPESQLPTPPPSGGSNGTMYRARITLDRAEVRGPCTIDVWVCKQPAGTTAFLHMPMKGIAKMFVPLDAAIHESSIRAPHITSAAMGHAITQNLSLKLKRVNGEEIPIESVTSLKVDIELADITVPESTREMPVVWQRRYMPVNLSRLAGNSSAPARRDSERPLDALDTGKRGRPWPNWA